VKISGVARAKAGNWFVVAGMNAGIMEKWGIQVHITTNPTSLAAITALLSGAGDLAPSTFDAGLQAQLQAPDVKWVAMGYNKTPFELIVAKDITNVEQLRGKTCGVQSLTSVDGLRVRLMLDEAAKMEFDKDYKMLVLGNATTASRLAALESGQIQCVAMPAPDTAVLNNAGYPTLLNAADMKAFHGQPYFGYVANVDSYENDPEKRALLERFMAALMESIVWLYDPANKTAAIQTLAKEAQLDPALAESAYEWVDIGGYRADLETTPEELQNTVNAAKTVGVLTLFTQDPADFIDPSLAEGGFKLLDPAMQAKVQDLVQKFNS
jgi:ABC-type nitrate/sulfonate/bicarbonate transport system substrate-binding protein